MIPPQVALRKRPTSFGSVLKPRYPARTAAEDVVLGCASVYALVRHSERTEEHLRAGVDFERLAEIADQQRVLPAVRAGLRRFRSISAQGSHVDQSWSSRGRGEVRRAVRVILGQLHDVFERRGLSFIPYKGPGLARLAYGDADGRDYRDLDILVPRSEVRLAVEALAAEGYRIPERQRAWPTWLYLALHHEYTLLKDGAPEIDLHWRLAPPYLWSPGLDFMFQRLRTIEMDDVTVRSLSVEDNFLMTCIHGTRHGWKNLVLVVDVANLIESQPGMDFEVVLETAERTGARRMVGVAAGLATTLLGTPLPARLRALLASDPVIAELVRDRSDRLFAEASETFTHLGAARFQMRCLPLRRDRFRYRVRLNALYAAHLLMMVLGDRATDVKGLDRLIARIVRPFQLIRRYGFDRETWREAIRF